MSLVYLIENYLNHMFDAVCRKNLIDSLKLFSKKEQIKNVKA